MPSEAIFSYSTLFGFLLVLTRFAGVFTFVPLPGALTGPLPARVFLSLAAAMAMYPRWPAIDETSITPGLLAAWMAGEAAIGLFTGVAISFLAEAITLGAQVISLPVGYAYASTIDPNTNADSGILIVIAQLLAGLLFFSLGMHRLVITALAASLDSFPPGSFALSRPLASQVIELGSGMFSAALRLALPVVAVLLMVDVALAALNRINMHVQMISLAFPIKMILGLLILAGTLTQFTSVYEGYARQAIGLIRRTLAH